MMIVTPRKLKRLIVVLALSIAAAVTAWSENSTARNEAPASASGYRLVRVFDGDSMLMRNPEGETLKMRIAGIDAPEKSQPFADPARDRLGELLQHGPLEVAILKKDVYGRWLASIRVADKDIGQLLLEEGHVWFFRRYQSDLTTEQKRLYDSAEKMARDARRGLWADTIPLPPWEFRQRSREARQREN
jgi:endonuclease YncB( thermonuclease family)